MQSKKIQDIGTLAKLIQKNKWSIRVCECGGGTGLNSLLFVFDLLNQLHVVYVGAPSTNFDAYKKAQKALLQLEDLTFKDDDLDAFLPKELKCK